MAGDPTKIMVEGVAGLRVAKSLHIAFTWPSHQASDRSWQGVESLTYTECPTEPGRLEKPSDHALARLPLGACSHASPRPWPPLSNLEYLSGSQSQQGQECLAIGLLAIPGLLASSPDAYRPLCLPSL